MVNCVKLGAQLPGLPFKPFNDALGQRIFDSISADAWKQWVEYSKKVINERRPDLTAKSTHDELKQMCEAFLFGDGPQVQLDDVPEGVTDGKKH